MDATDIGYGFSMNGIQPTGTITTGNIYFVTLNKSMNDNNTRFNTLIFLSVIVILIFPIFTIILIPLQRIRLHTFLLCKLSEKPKRLIQ